ncbi:MAG: T9SS type A sorting domain-containing protein [Bacteroidota bacterium]
MERAESFSIANNASLATIDAFGSLTSVTTLDISGNIALADLDAFVMLAEARRNVLIQTNESLSNVDGLAALRSVGRDLDVRFNPALGDCADGLGPLLTEGSIGRDTRIDFNATGCNSVDEVVALFTDIEPGAAPLTTALTDAYPNPSTGTLSLAYTLAAPAEVTLAVYDVLGRLVATLEEGPRGAGTHEIDGVTTRLPAGAYVLRLAANGERFARRFEIVR